MKKCAVSLVAALGVVAMSGANATLITDFSGASLDSNLHLDVPNSSAGNITLNSGAGSLDFVANSSLNMWTTRANAPFAWTSGITVAAGQKWYAETRVSAPTNSNGVIAGLTFYGGPDGAGGSGSGMDFTFALDHWDFGTATVFVQGLGDNSPGIGSGNLTGGTLSAVNPSVYLRTEITENGATDAYAFYYKMNAGDAWTQFGSFNSSVNNSRVALFLKTSSTGSASFDYFNVDAVGGSAPEPGSLALMLAGLGGVAGIHRRRSRNQGQNPVA